MKIIAQMEREACPNGLALSTDEKFLYVAQYNGIDVIDPATGKSRKFETPPGESVAAVDGLSMAGDSLIGIQNLSEPPRVIKIKYISSDGATSDRETYLKRLTSGDYGFQRQNVSDIRVWINGTTAVATPIPDDKFNFRGKPYAKPVSGRFTSV